MDKPNIRYRRIQDLRKILSYLTDDQFEDFLERLDDIVFRMKVERLATELWTHRFDKDEGIFIGPDNFYAGVVHIVNLLKEAVENE